jgi:hypothetical protein
MGMLCRLCLVVRRLRGARAKTAAGNARYGTVTPAPEIFL